MELHCIFCKKNEKDGEKHILTDEHVIPECLGGWLTIPFVCKTCNNDFFGSKIESKLKKNAFIVSAIESLDIQPKNKALRSATVHLEFSDSHIAKGYIRNSGETEFIPTVLADGSMIAPEVAYKEILKKKIERYEKANNVKIDFDVNEIDSFPCNIVIPIYGTDIYFMRHEGKKAKVTISNLDTPILFDIPAKIAFEHLSGFSYPFIMQDEFNSFRAWLLDGGLKYKVLSHTLLRNVKNPYDLNYKPFHFIRYKFFDNDLTALVGLFGIIVHSVYLGKIRDPGMFPDKRLLDIYHVYDLNSKNVVFDTSPPTHIIDWHNHYMETVCNIAKAEIPHNRFQNH